MSPHQKLDSLLAKLENLQRAHQNTSIELVKLREEINLLKSEMGLDTPFNRELSASKFDEGPPAKYTEEEIPEIKIDYSQRAKKSVPPPLPTSTPPKPHKDAPVPKKAFNLEGFIGGNLINKIGILILIIGLGLFVKYAIDNGYFPPLVRLILSFLAGLTLVVIGYRLKGKYKTYSAVLFSGGITVLYFSTYAGNAFYDPILIPRATAFILMTVFTIVTVIAAMMYGLEIIALLGLVGAYAVPLLLSDDSGNYRLFLSYIAIINTGVLLVSIRRHWRLTLYSAFALTWLIFAFWILAEEYQPATDTGVAWIFNAIFFFLFYAALAAYNLINNKKFTIDNVLLITFNTFIFYGLGMVLLENKNLDNFHGLFTLSVGLLHLLVSLGVYNRLEDKKLFYAISGLFWIFLTIAVGVQFDADISSVLWLGEAALLFGIGRRFKIRLYEGASLLVLFLGLNFLMATWLEGYYDSLVAHSLIVNKYFLISFLALLVLGVMQWVHYNWKTDWSINKLIDVLFPGLIVGVLYFAFFNEIYHQFEISFLNSEVNTIRDASIQKFRVVWLINYTFIFILLLTVTNQYYFKNKIAAGAVAIVSALVLLIFISGGVILLNDLRSEYLNPAWSPEFAETSYWIWIRYICYLLVAAVLYGLYKSIDWIDNNGNLKLAFQLYCYLILLVILSSELTTFMTLILGVDTASLTHRVGFSILWAVFSLAMILIGFKQRSKILRVAAIVLFGVTLIKVFFLDLIDISTESRILLFVAIGVLLLVTSYFYQRYGDRLLGEKENEDA